MRIPKSTRFILTIQAFYTILINGQFHEDSIVDINSAHAAANAKDLRLWLTISAQKRFIEISWKNAPAGEHDHILLTTQEPHTFEKVKFVTGTPLAEFDTAEGSGYLGINGVTSTTEVLPQQAHKIGFFEEDYEQSGDGATRTLNLNRIGAQQATPVKPTPAKPKEYWSSNGGQNDIVAAIKPSATSQWLTTGVPFDYELSRNVTLNTNCYGFWASYIDDSGKILALTCFRAYPHWMRDMNSIVATTRLRDLFIPGTHDSGSYRPNFDPLIRETLVTKYALTQDEDIRTQLMHGVRYLDIRVGYYPNTHELFYINHGITRQRPLSEVINQVRDFVLDTNEIVIFGLKEFPVGFGKTLGVHRLLVQFLKERFGDLIVHPSATWQATLRDIWSRRQNVILAYDKGSIVLEFPHVLFGSVEQRWGNVQKWEKLKQFLEHVNTYDRSRLSSRPVADMAELTPDTWGILLDKYGGLRKMADNVNWRVSQLYRDELGAFANIVAVDFIRGTTIIETAIDWNRRKITY